MVTSSSLPWAAKKIINNSTTPPLHRLRAISMDVTGTIISFSGKLEDHYGEAAKRCGLSSISDDVVISRIPQAFNRAYKETSADHPCFGGPYLTSKQWWRKCVLRSFELAAGDEGVDLKMSSEEKERVFQRVYSTFGGHATYEVFSDAKPFLKWARRRGVVCGVVSNADERYGDSILPMLGLGDDLSFLCFSKDFNVEKPDPRFFLRALRAAEPWLPCCIDGDGDEGEKTLHPSEVLHIGNDFKKDYVGAREAGFHAILMDRFDEEDLANEWREAGAPVFKDLIDVVEWVGREGFDLG